MTTQSEIGKEKRLVASVLPWLIALAGIVVYLLTVNRWVSFNNIGQVARSAGWAVGPELFAPLYYLLTYPAHWLPVQWMPLALNLFSVGCAALILALLARSVALMPHDRTENQRLRERGRFALLSIPSAWIPPVLAAAVCGLQLSFWESATGGASTLLNLLIVAYVIRCLLEYRISDRDSWLLRASLVSGIGMANSWVIFCLVPVFIISLIWIRGLTLFDPRFLLKMFLCAAAGMLMYLVMPLIYVSSADAVGSFWQALKINLQMDRNYFTYFTTTLSHHVQLLLMMTSFLPILVIGIRWASNFGDPSRLGSALATWVFHLAHGALLGACVWAAFDPVFSARHLGAAFPALTEAIPILYYLGALSVGYLSGYFLLVFIPLTDRVRRAGVFQKGLYTLSLGMIWILLFLVPAGLIVRNAPQIKMTNGPALKDYASQLVRNLPDRAILLSDSDESRDALSRKLLLAQSWLSPAGVATNYFFINTELLTVPSYHAIQAKLHPGEWPDMVNVKSFERVNPVVLINLVARLASRMPVYYTHPSFGYYFEIFYPRPRGLTYEMKYYSTNSISKPPLTDEEIAENEKFWNDNQVAVDRLIPFITERRLAKPGFEQKLLKKLHIAFEPNAMAVALGKTYSQALNTWGVELQRAGRLKEAAVRLQSAAALNPDNIAAQCNLEVNRDLQAGRKTKLRTPRSLDDEFGKFRSWEQLLRENGPFDDPTHCFGQGMTFTQNSLFRQAAQEFERVHQLVPENIPAQFWLGQLYIRNLFPEKGLELVSAIRAAGPKALEDSGIQKVDLWQMEFTALLIDTNRTLEAEQAMQRAMLEEPNNQNLLAMVVQLSVVSRRYTNALSAVDRQLEMRPDDPVLLLNKGIFNLELRKYADAIPSLSRALSLQTTNNYTIRLCLAYANLGADQRETAKKYYEELLKANSNSVEVNSGLAEIAWRDKNTNDAIFFYQQVRTNTQPGSEAFNKLTERIDSLKPAP